MNPLNLATATSPPPAASELLAKRKRGRPRKDETVTQQENSHMTQKPDANLVGKVVSGVVEGSFDAGYILNVKVKDSDTKLRGVVFLPGKVTPITQENDVAPNVKMFVREEIKNQTEDRSQSRSLPNDEEMKDADGDISDLEIAESAQTLSLLAHQTNGGTFNPPKEAMETETRLVEFFPTPETIASDQTNLVSAEKEKVAEEQEKAPACPGDKVPEELQLELGNKTTMRGDGEESSNGNAAAMETDGKTSVSKSGFIANLFEGKDKKVDCEMDEQEATPSVQ